LILRILGVIRADSMALPHWVVRRRFDEVMHGDGSSFFLAIPRYM
jgi:hypothetical protein